MHIFIETASFIVESRETITSKKKKKEKPSFSLLKNKFYFFMVAGLAQ